MHSPARTENARPALALARGGVLGLCVAACVAAAGTPPERLPGAVIDSPSAAVLDAFTGEILFAKDPDLRVYPASTTKILTALLVIEAGGLERHVVIERADTCVEPTAIGLRPGESRARLELLHALLLRSANDVALALARDNAGSIAAFAGRMTRRAAELGATSSRFVNPHGLHDPGHYTTARDLVRIARCAMQQPLFRRLVSTPLYPWRAADGTVIDLHSTNRLLHAYPGCNGLKTGYTRRAGRVLVGSALRDGAEIISVVFRGDNASVWRDSRVLLDLGFRIIDERLERRPLALGQAGSGARAGAAPSL